VKKILLSLMILSASISFATQTRIAGLGVNNWNIEDDYNIWFNPALINHYNKLIIGELGTGAIPAGLTPNILTVGTQWGGINYDFGIGYGVFGLYLQRPYAGRIGNGTLATNLPDANVGKGWPFGAAGTHTAITDFSLTPSPLSPLAPANQFDLLWGYAIDKINFGIAINYAYIMNNPKYNYDATGTNVGDGTFEQKFTSSDLNISVGTCLMELGPFAKFEGVITYGLPSYEVTQIESAIINTATGAKETADSKIESKPGTNLAFLLRGINEISTSSKLISTFIYEIHDVSGKWTATNDANGDGATTDDFDRTGEFKDKLTTIRFDTALNYNLGDSTLFILALGFVSQTIEQSIDYTSNETALSGKYQSDTYKAETIRIPLNIALEHNITNEITGRIGVSKWLFSTGKTSVTDKNDNAGIANPDPTKYELDETIETTSPYGTADTATVLTTGLGIKITNNLTIDATLRQHILFGGPYFISGVPNSLFGQLTAVYRF
jgi:hypothetical protein